MNCPCGSDKELAACCEPYLQRKASAPTAEALMRSRYVAYVQEDVDYIIDTHDPSTRDGIDRDETMTWAASSNWLGLEIVETSAGGPDDKRGEVEFVARYEDERGRVHVHRERSEFRKQDGQWYFYDGNVRRHEPVVRAEPKVGRNDPCPCGSGQKYKKCHGRPGAPALVQE